MLSRRNLVLTLALAASGTPCLASDVLPNLGAGRVFGHFIGDEGNVVLGIKHRRSNFQTRLVLWTGSDTRTLEVDYGGDFPILFKDLQAAPGGSDTFILKGAMKVDDTDHGAIVYQAYRLTSSGKLRQLWSIDTGQWIQDDPTLSVSPDGAMWGIVDGSIDNGRTVADDKRLHFAFGTTKSSKIRRRETLAFDQGPHRAAEPEFHFLSSRGPVVLAAYADDYHILRFTDFGVNSQPVDAMRPVRRAYGSAWPLVRWQADDRILWGNDGHEWAAWDLWDLGLSGFPEEPFFRFESSSGEPHPVRGFVRKTFTDRGYRVEHLWQSPQVEHLKEHHASDWRPGKPISVSVSPNGRHAVALEEVREEKDGEVESRQVLRRFELAPVPPPPPRPTRSEEEP